MPSTYDRATALLLDRLQPLGLSHVVFERRDEPLRVTAGGTRAALQVVADLAAEPPEALDLADAEIFLADRLASPQAGFYRQRLAAAGPGAVRFEPRFFSAHGPALVVLLHSWAAVGEPVPLPADGTRLTARLDPPAGAGEAFSLAIELAVAEAPTIEVGGRLVPLYLTQDRGRKGSYVSARFRLPEGRAEVSLGLPLGPDPNAPRPATLHRWQRRAARP